MILHSAATISVGLLINPLAAHAATVTWGCAAGNWADSACWSSATPPTGADTVNVFTVSGANTNLAIDGSTGTASAGNLTLDASSGTAVALQQSGGQLGTGYEFIGYSGSGLSSYTESGGTNSASNFLYLAYGLGSDSSYALSGGAVTAGNEVIGNA